MLKSSPKNATKPEQFAQALIPFKIRRDIERKSRIDGILAALDEGRPISADFAESVRKAADDVKAEEQRQLTEYVLRRKIVLDVLDSLINRWRELDDGSEDFYLEETVHQFICPMRVRGDDRRLENTDHELWIIDERLAFAK